MRFKTLTSCICAAAALPLLAALDKNTLTNLTPAATMAEALNWTDAANWSLGRAPALADDIYAGSISATQLVRLPDDLTVQGLHLNNKYSVIAGERLSFSSQDVGGNPRFYSGWIFADVSLQTSSSDISPWVGGDVHICGRMLSPYGNIIPAGNTVYHNLDSYATSANPVRTDDVQIGSSYAIFPGNANMVFYAAGAEASTSAWRLTAGSPYLTLADASAAYVAAGATVTGAGIPDGTYVRRRLTSTELELSQAATETAASNTLSFAAFHPKATLKVPTYKRQGTDASAFKACKRCAEDQLDVDIDTFSNAGSVSSPRPETWLLGLETKDTGWLPGRFILHNVNGGHKKGVSDMLRNAHLLLAGTPAGASTTFDENRIVAFESAAYTARITVTNDPAGVIANFTNFVGTLVKDGAGTLKIGLADAANTGRISIEAGTLELTARASAGTDGVSFANLAMAAGATLKLPSAGMTVTTATLEDGAVVAGPGVLTVLGGKSGDVTCTGGARVVYPVGAAAATSYVHEPVAQVAGHPAFWVDASKTDSLVYTAEDGVNYVTRWNDCREGEPMFATNVVRRPKLVQGGTMATTYVKMDYVETHLYTNTEGLVWSEPIKDIRAVFLVQDPSDGGGEILGRTTRLPDSYYGSQGGPYYRSGDNSYARTLVSENYATDRVKYGRFFLDGQEVCGYKSGYLGNYMQLLEHHANTNYATKAPDGGVWCDAFGTGGYKDGLPYANANGRQRIAECIIYTNSLTHAERVETALYLSRKWLGKDITYTDVDAPAKTNAVAMASGEALSVGSDEIYGVARVEEGSALTKDGAGTLVVDSLDAGTVKVNAGELRVKSLSLANTSVPTGAWVHVDAADAETLELGANNAVSRWNKVVDDGWGYRVLTGTPHLVPDVLNGHPVVDCGVMNGTDKGSLILSKAGEPLTSDTYTHSDADKYITGAPLLRTVFIVYGSKGGGNSLLGCYGNGFPYQGLAHCPNTAGGPILMSNAGGYRAFTADECKAFSNGTFVARLNGVAFDPLVTPFSGAYDLLTVSGDFNRKSDTLATFGQGWNGYVGGLEYGEVLIYSNKLSAATLPKVEAYLRKKWFNADTAGYRTAACDALEVASGAVVSVADYAVAQKDDAYAIGTGTLATGALTGGGTVKGAVTLADNGVVTATAADGTFETLTVAGSLTLPGAAILRVTGDVASVAPGTYRIIAADALENPQTTWTVEAPAAPKRIYRVRHGADGLSLTVTATGTTLLLR